VENEGGEPEGRSLTKSKPERKKVIGEDGAPPELRVNGEGENRRERRKPFS